MKKLSIFLAMIVAFAAFAIAAEHADNQMKDQTVEEINQLEEGEEVKLEGKLIENLDEENIYFFQDDTGIIEVEVSQDVWDEENLQFNPDQEYEIKGEVVIEEEVAHVKANKIEEAGEGRQDEGKRQDQDRRQDQERRPDETEDDGFLF